MEVPKSITNRHVTEFLTYYVGLKDPRYAVLLDGPWGIGKTYLINSFLQTHFPDPYDYVYVSLYGLKSADEIDMALLHSMHPWTGTKTAKILSRVAGAACQAFRVNPNLNATDVFSRPIAKIYVFDDLERCEMPLNASMGYLNSLVEHDGCRVVIVANSSEIEDQKTFLRRREKLIGKTLEIQSSFDDAFAQFLAKIRKKLQTVLEVHRETIAAIYQQSQLNNLRILQQAIWDFERVLDCWSDEHLTSGEAVASAVHLFFAISFEIRSGRMVASDLGHENSWARYLDDKSAPSAFELARKRYAGSDLYDGVLSSQVLIDVIVRGLVDCNAVRLSLEQSRYFVTGGVEPSWRTAWHFFERRTEDVLAAYADVEQKFLSREYDEIGELLHVFGLRLQMSDAGVLAKERGEVLKEGKAYIDDLYNRKRLAPLPINQGGEDFRYAGYGGLGIQQVDSLEYKDLYQYLWDKRQKAFEDTYIDIASQLLEEMTSDIDLFFRRICESNTPDSLYARVPVLSSIDVDVFVDRLTKLEPARQRTVFSALKARYEYGRLNRDLGSEKVWLETMLAKLRSKTEKMTSLDRFRIERSIAHSVEPILTESAGASSAAR